MRRLRRGVTPGWYRRSGATLPFADPARFHGVAMEGSYWRFTHAARGEVTIVLRGDCRGADGRRWALLALAAHPGGVLRWAIVDAGDARCAGAAAPGAGAAAGAAARGAGAAAGAAARGAGAAAGAAARGAGAAAGAAARGAGAATRGAGAAAHGAGAGAAARGATLADGPGRLRASIDDVALDATWTADVPWPAGSAFGGLGPAQSIPWLGQYWHPHLLRGAARGALRIGDEVRSLDGASVYAEANWGSTFAGHWWWGQAHTDDAAVAFAGGRLLGGAPTALVVATEEDTLRFTPPLARMRVATEPGRWRLAARSPRHTVEVEAEADPAAALMLPVPEPAQRRAALRSAQHLTGRLEVTVRRGRRLWLRGATELAGLERGAP